MLYGNKLFPRPPEPREPPDTPDTPDTELGVGLGAGDAAGEHRDGKPDTKLRDPTDSEPDDMLSLVVGTVVAGDPPLMQT